MSIRIQQGALINHSYRLDSIATDIKSQATEVEAVMLDNEAFGFMFGWIATEFKEFFGTDGETVREHADTVSRCAEALRWTARDFAETDSGVADDYRGN